MRIIGGKNKGRKLKSFDGTDIRPTSDRAKESLFNILNSSVLDCDFLDLCAGTGAIGIESYSRGAKSVTFVDNSKESLNLAKFNGNLVGLSETFVLSKAVDFLKTTSQTFDIIFYDPPYKDINVNEVLKIIKERKILNENGLFIYEKKSDTKTFEVQGFEIIDSRKYGIAVFDFYKESLWEALYLQERLTR